MERCPRRPRAVGRGGAGAGRGYVRAAQRLDARALRWPFGARRWCGPMAPVLVGPLPIEGCVLTGWSPWLAAVARLPPPFLCRAQPWVSGLGVKPGAFSGQVGTEEVRLPSLDPPSLSGASASSPGTVGHSCAGRTWDPGGRGEEASQRLKEGGWPGKRPHGLELSLLPYIGQSGGAEPPAGRLGATG